MTPADFSLVLTFGFVSSLHCIQMCGPIVLTYSVAAHTNSGPRPLFGLHLAYNAGRTVTYMFLGAIAGLAGGAMGWVGRLAGITHIAALIAGIAMVITGISLLGFAPGFNGWRGLAMPPRLLRIAGKLISSRSFAAKFTLGLVMGFLPCGLVYGALMKAIGEATPLNGALTMLAFSLGTTVALVAVGLGSSAATRQISRWGTTISAVTVMVMGVVLIARSVLAGSMNHQHMMHHMPM